MYKLFFKRFIDLLFSAMAFVILLPLFFLITVLLWSANKGYPFFTQIRPGKKAKPFRVIKFKTMNDDCDPLGNLLPDEQRLTVLGKVVRKTSLDEIPQLLNVMFGEMSFIGPRPLLTEYVELYSPEQRRRLEIRPGITGWAQVNGRNALEWKKRFEHDVWYVDHISFLLDIKILWLTIIKVFKAEGITSGTSATMEKFKGN